MASDKWHWQEPETAWKGVGIYHVTLTIPSREPLLGSLVIPDNDPTQAFVERTDLGQEIVHTIFHIQDIHPEEDHPGVFSAEDIDLPDFGE